MSNKTLLSEGRVPRASRRLSTYTRSALTSFGRALAATQSPDGRYQTFFRMP